MIDYQAYKDITQTFNLDKDNAEDVEKYLSFFQRKGRIETYKLLLCGIIMSYQNSYRYDSDDIPKIKPERVTKGLEDGLFTVNDFTIKLDWVMEYMDEIVGKEWLKQFVFNRDKPFYNKMVNDVLQKGDGKGFDVDVLLGYMNINRLKKEYRLKIINKATDPKKMFKLLTPRKQLDTAIAYIEEGYDEPDAIAVCIPFLKARLIQLTQLEDVGGIKTFGNKILNAESLRTEIKHFCPLLKQIYDRFNVDRAYPFTLPRFKACSRKHKHMAGFDFVGSKDEWGQHIIKLRGKFGIADAKGKVIIEPKYTSIGVPQNGVRIALDKYGYPMRLDKYNQQGQLITGE
jgi:hypothetical protein